MEYGYWVGKSPDEHAECVNANEEVERVFTPCEDIHQQFAVSRWLMPQPPFLDLEIPRFAFGTYEWVYARTY